MKDTTVETLLGPYLTWLGQAYIRGVDETGVIISFTSHLGGFQVPSVAGYLNG